MKNIKIVVSHPTGNANVRYLVSGLARTKLLGRFYTCVAVFENTFLYNILKKSPLKELTKRSFTAAVKNKTKTKPFKELMRIFSLKFGFSNLSAHETGKYSIDAVYKDLDSYVAKKLKKNEAIYAYEDGALESFISAEQKGLYCLYDLPIGYWRSMRALLEKELHDRPDWAVTLTGFKDSDDKVNRKDKELALADHIFVASNFTKKTLELYPQELSAVHVVPYGFPETYKNRVYDDFKGRKIKLLFVGGLSQRKGIANVFEAVEELSEYFTLTVIGKKAAEGCKPLEEGLKKHNWIPALPHDEILKAMREHDILVFPSLFEGYGLVITEAMSQGTPVISTDRTCAADFIKDNQNGWLVEAGNTKSLTDKLLTIKDNPAHIETVGKAAVQTASARPSSMYGDEMVKVIKTILKENV